MVCMPETLPNGPSACSSCTHRSPFWHLRGSDSIELPDNTREGDVLQSLYVLHVQQGLLERPVRELKIADQDIISSRMYSKV